MVVGDGDATLLAHVHPELLQQQAAGGEAEFTATRHRFSAFDRLHASVMEATEGLTLALPPKTLISNTTTAFLENRRAQLQAFVERLLGAVKDAYALEEIAAFLGLSMYDDKSWGYQ